MAVEIPSSKLRLVGNDDDTILDLDQLQGLWTVEQYLRLSDHSHRLLEFTDGALEGVTDAHGSTPGDLAVFCCSP